MFIHKSLSSSILQPMALGWLKRHAYSTFCPYKTLKISQTASAKEIKSAYYALVKSHHPDKSNTTLSKNQFLDIVKAYDLLRNPERRRMHDLGNSKADGSKSPQRKGRQAQGQNDPVYERYYQMAGTHRGPLYMTNGRMATIIVFLACLGGIGTYHYIQGSRKEFKAQMNRLESRTRSYYNQVLSKAKTSSLESEITKLKELEKQNSKDESV